MAMTEKRKNEIAYKILRQQTLEKGIRLGSSFSRNLPCKKKEIEDVSPEELEDFARLLLKDISEQLFGDINRVL